MLDTVNKPAQDLSEQSETYWARQTITYDGAYPFRALKTKSSALKSVLTDTERQRNVTRNDVMCSSLRVHART